ncbi:MAG: 4Fe-4S binding protein [Spirochaetaceae bacterium]|jgi:NADH-quinone oxidoreductase subunit F|nr:4Fe-4S binding protein [Spirochaetaceae bacterium]
MRHKLKDRADLQEARSRYAAALGRQQKRIFVCAGTGCVASGSLAVYDRLLALMQENNIDCAVELRVEPEATLHHSHHHGDRGSYHGIKKSGCHGFCEMGPLVLIEPDNYLYTRVKADDCAEIVAKTIMKGEVCERLTYRRDGEAYPKRNDIPFFKGQTRLVLEHCGQIDAASIEEAIAVGGYAAFEKALFEMTPDEIIAEMTASNLRGRGGAGFPTGRKWQQVQRQAAAQKYVVCNGDEGDPGAFMDRSVMEGDPHRMIEGMLIAALASGANAGYVYVRAEYPLAVERLKTAIVQALAAGLLGDNILGSGFGFRLRINRGAGAFVCGEGSALTASIEGKRGMPRVKFFRTVEKGLFECPTVLNNVETFANVPLIITRGADWFKSIGPPGSPGTKTFALTGAIANTGLIEVPMGTTLGEVILNIGGGPPAVEAKRGGFPQEGAVVSPSGTRMPSKAFSPQNGEADACSQHDTSKESPGARFARMENEKWIMENDVIASGARQSSVVAPRLDCFGLRPRNDDPAAFTPPKGEADACSQHDTSKESPCGAAGVFKAVQIGGPSGGCLTAEHFDLPLDFDSLKKIGAIIGSGGLVVMDRDTCMVEVARFFMHFTQNESCGKCVPCREGTKRMLAVLERITGGEGRKGDVELLLELADAITNTALCGLGKTAAGPVVSTIRWFRDEYDAHIKHKSCPAGSCQKLRALVIDPKACVGCTKCARNCPADAIRGAKKEPHTIDPAKCIKCMACIDACPMGAIFEYKG